MFVIITDGLENSSREYSYAKVKKMIESKKELGWEFLFLRANIDAVEAAVSKGISINRAVNFRPDPAGVRLNYAALSDVVCFLRKSPAPLPDDWKKRIEEDFEERKEN